MSGKTIHTDSAYRDILSKYIQKNCKIPKCFEPFHFEITHREHYDILCSLKQRFVKIFIEAAHSAISNYYREIHVSRLYPDTNSEEHKQAITKLALGFKKHRHWSKFDALIIEKIHVTFSVSTVLLPVRSISSLQASDINKPVSFNATIIGVHDRLARIKKVKTLNSGIVSYDSYQPKHDGRITQKYYEYLQYLTVEEIKPVNKNIHSYKIALKLPDNLVGKLYETKKYRIAGFYSVEEEEKTNEIPLYIEGISIDRIQEKKITPLSDEKIKYFKELSKNDPEKYLSDITKSYAPHIYENNIPKLGMLLAHLDSVELASYRNELFLVLVGVPGGGKSEILKYMENILPDFIYIDSQGVSTRGLLFSQSEYKKQKILHRGALLQYKNVVVDEFDKLDKDHKKSLNTVVEQRIATYNKSPFNESAQIDANLTIGGNPVNSKWDIEKGILKNLESIGDTLIDRGLIIKVETNKNVEQKLAHIFGTILNEPTIKPPIPLDVLTSLYDYASSHKPKFTRSAANMITEFLVSVQKIPQTDDQDLPIETRKELDLLRLSSKMAQLLLRDTIDDESVRHAISFYKECLSSVGMNTTNITTTQRLSSFEGNKQDVFWVIFRLLEKEDENKHVNETRLKKEMMISDKWVTIERINKFIDLLRNKGEIYEPSPGELKRC